MSKDTKDHLFKPFIYDYHDYLTPIYTACIFIVFIMFIIIILSLYRGYNIKLTVYICSLVGIFGIAIILISILAFILMLYIEHKHMLMT